jgi:hypothetical protein
MPNLESITKKIEHIQQEIARLGDELWENEAGEWLITNYLRLQAVASVFRDGLDREMPPWEEKQTTRRIPTGCIDCEWAEDWFVVTNEVWAAAGLAPWAFCCLPCLERRLKRPLNIDDFTICPVNRPAYAATGRLSVVIEHERRHGLRAPEPFETGAAGDGEPEIR